MTCIVGYIEKSVVHIGGDSAGTDDSLSLTIRKDPKVFKQGPFIMGFTTSFRMGQLLMSSRFISPKQKANQTDYDFMVTDFVDAVRNCFKDGGYLQKEDSGEEKGGMFLVGYKGVLYEMHEDFQVGIPHEIFSACGCGDDLAKGAFFAIKNMDFSPIKKMEMALNSANHFSAGVAPPYNYVSMSIDESKKEILKLKSGKSPVKKGRNSAKK